VQNAENSKNENLPCCWSGAHDWRMQHEIPEMKDESVQMHFMSRRQLAGMEFVAHDLAQSGRPSRPWAAAMLRQAARARETE
jgi:hypothetical protein